MIDDIIVDYYIGMKVKREKIDFDEGILYIYIQVVAEINFRILSVQVKLRSLGIDSSSLFITFRKRMSTEIARLTI